MILTDSYVYIPDCTHIHDYLYLKIMVSASLSTVFIRYKEIYRIRNEDMKLWKVHAGFSLYVFSYYK